MSSARFPRKLALLAAGGAAALLLVVLVVVVVVLRSGPASDAGGPGSQPANGSPVAVKRTSVNGRIWEKQFEVGREALGKSFGIRGLVISPGGERLGVCGQTVKLFDLASGNEVADLGADRFISINSVACAPGGKWLVWSRRGIDGKLVVSDFDGKKQEQVEGHLTDKINPNTNKPIYQFTEVLVSPDGRRFASAPRLEGEKPTTPPQVKVFDLETRRFVRWMPGSGPAAFAPDGNTIAVKGDPPHQVLVYPVALGGPVQTLTCPTKGKTDHVWQIAYSPDGRTLATVSPVGLLLWDITKGTVRDHFVKAEKDIYPRFMSFSGNGKRLAVGYNLEAGQRPIGNYMQRETRGLVKVFDLDTGAVAALEAQDTLYAVALSHDGTIVATAGNAADKLVTVWRERAGQEGVNGYVTADQDREDDKARLARAKEEVAQLSEKASVERQKLRFDYKSRTRAEFIAKMREVLRQNGWGEILKPARPRPVTQANFEYDVFMDTFGQPDQGYKPPDQKVNDRPVYTENARQVWTYRCSDGSITLRVELGWPRLIVDDIVQ